MARRRALIFLLSFNAIAASIVVALVTVLLTSSSGHQLSALQTACLEGGPADASASDSSTVTGSEIFETVDAAEAFICHHIVYPRNLKGLSVEYISASRLAPARDIVQGHGFASITLDYKLAGNAGTDLRVEVSPFEIDPVTFGIVDQVKIMGVDANLIRGKDPNLVVLQWQSSGYSFYSEARLTAQFSMTDLLAVLNSIR